MMAAVVWVWSAVIARLQKIGDDGGCGLVMIGDDGGGDVFQSNQRLWFGYGRL